MDVIHHDLETVEALHFCSLNLARESLDQIFVNNAIRSGEESEDVRDEVTLIVV
jgi:hypothetical protein